MLRACLSRLRPGVRARAGPRAAPPPPPPLPSSRALRGHCDEALPAGAPTVELVFAGGRGPTAAAPVRVRATVGSTVLSAARAAGVDLEGACECSLACSTCHVVLPQPLFRALPPATDEEEDLLDLAFALTPTSRLGCQVRVTAAFDGAEVTLPMATRNLYVDGHVPKPH